MSAGNRVRVSRNARVVSSVILALVCLVQFLLFPAPSLAQSAGQANAAIEAIGARVAGDDRKTRFVLDLNHPIAYTVTVTPDPFRVVIDMPAVAFKLPAGIGKMGRGLVRRYRYGQFDGDKARIVIDASGPVLIDKTFLVEPSDNSPARMVIDLVQTDEKTFATILARLNQQEKPAPVASPEPAGSKQVAQQEPQTVGERTALATVEASPKPSMPPRPKPKPTSFASIIESLSAKSTGPEIATAEAPAAASAQAPTADMAVVEPTAAFSPATLAAPKPKAKAQAPQPKQNRRPVIVIDPGHGGVDPGAISRSGTLEKNVVLGFARALRDALKSSGRYDVQLTRDNDTFITLGGRVEIAQKHNADLFISIHADSLKRGIARGSTIYTVSERASDQEAAEIAAAENKADLVGGIPPEAENEQLTDILVDLVQRETRNHSMFFAKTLVGELKDTTRLNTKPHRYAGFRVLRAPDVPSVLLELGYLSSPEDEKLLTSDAWRKRVAGAIVSAIDGFFGTHVAQRR